MIGEELVEHLGLEPSSISLQGRYADPARAPIGFALGGQTLQLRVQRSDGEKGGSDPANGRHGAWGRFRAHLSAASTRRFHQISFPGEWLMVRPTGIEPVSVRWRRTALPLSYGRGAQSRTRTCEARRHLIYSQASLPLEYLCVIDGAGDLAIARTYVGGRLTVRTPHLAVPTRFQDGLPATPAEPSFWTSRRDLNARPPPSDGGALSS